LNTNFHGYGWYHETTKFSSPGKTYVTKEVMHVMNKYQNDKFKCQRTSHYMVIHEN